MSNDYPKLDVTTKYGAVTLTFLDPDADGTHDRRGQPILESDKNVARVEGEIVVNRIPVKVSARLVYAPVLYRKGKELETPEREMREAYSSSYHKRTDVQFGGDLTSGIRQKLHELWNGDVRAAYESRPDLQKAAQRARLAYDLEMAKNKRDAAYEAYKASEKALSDASDVLESFGREV